MPWDAPDMLRGDVLDNEVVRSVIWIVAVVVLAALGALTVYRSLRARVRARSDTARIFHDPESRAP